MDLFKIIESELLRPLVTLIIPGSIVIAPIFAAFYYKYPELQVAFKAENHNLTIIFILLILSLAVGLILEDLGSQVELKFRETVKSNLGSTTTGESIFEEHWKKYLNLTVSEKETKIALNYIDSIVLRLKFELSMGIGLIFAGIFYFFSWMSGLLTLKHLLSNSFFTGILIILGRYLVHEAYVSVKTLHDIRQKIDTDQTVVTTDDHGSG